MTENDRQHKGPPRNTAVAAACVVFVAAMIGLAYASVPLYRLFCQVTGYGGTTQLAEQEAERVLDRTMKIRFDANASRDLSWRFTPVQREIEIRIGETGLAFYQAENRSAEATTGTATFNVTPLEAGQYFNKIECFCFTEQTLASGQTADMPVSFFVDPAIDDDPDLAHVTTITLSYTFFAVEDEEQDERETAAVPEGTDTGLN